MNNLNSILDYLKVFNNINKRPAHEPRTMAQGGGIIGKPGGLVEPGVMYYGKLTLDRQNAGPKLKSYVSQYNKLVQKDFDKGNLAKTKTFKKFLEGKINNVGSYVQQGRDLGATDLFAKKRDLLDKLILENQDDLKYVKWDQLEKKVYEAPGRVKRLSMYEDLYKKHLELNGPKTKINKAFEYLLNNDVPLKAPDKMTKNLARRSLLNQTIADLTGVGTITVEGKGMPVGQWLRENNNLYRQQEDLINYANKAGLFSQSEGKSLSTILDDAAYRSEGNIVWSDSFGKAKMSRPSKRIFTYGLKHFNYHGKNKTGESQLQFFHKGDTKMQNPIKWDDVPFNKDGTKSLSHNDVFFTFKDDPKKIWNSSSLDDDHKLFKAGKQTSTKFDDLYKATDVYDNLLATDITVGGNKMTFGDAMRQVYQTGFDDWSKSAFAVDHIDGIAKNPFKNLRIASQRINVALSKIPKLKMFSHLDPAEASKITNRIQKELVKSTYGIDESAKKVIPKIIKDYTPLMEDVLVKGKKFDQKLMAETIQKLGLNEFLNPVAKSMQTNLSPQSIMQMGRTHGCLKKQEGGSIMSCLQGKFKADPEKFLQKSAPLAKNNVNLFNWFKNGRKIARGTGVALAWEAAFAPIIGAWSGLEGESMPRILNDIAYGIPGIGETTKDEFMKYAGGNEKAWIAKRLDEIQTQELPLLQEQRNRVINKMAHTEGKSFHQRTIEDDIKEKELEYQDLWNKSGFEEGPAGGALWHQAASPDAYFNMPALTEAHQTYIEARDQIAADKAARKKQRWESYVPWSSQLQMAEGGIMSLKRK